MGKASSRDLSGPIHVFEGKRKPGRNGWPSGITWMVSETYKGSLEGIKWPASLIGIVLTVSFSPERFLFAVGIGRSFFVRDTGGASRNLKGGMSAETALVPRRSDTDPEFESAL